LWQSEERVLVELNFDDNHLSTAFFEYNPDHNVIISKDEVSETVQSILTANTRLKTHHTNQERFANKDRYHHKQMICCRVSEDNVETVEALPRYQCYRDRIDRLVNIVLHRTWCVDNSERYQRLDFYMTWPGRSPTVNISWFIAKAYLANLYYNTQRDLRATIDTCDEFIQIFNQSKYNRWFAENSFPVILSTQWIGLYDKEIQEMLGFYSLCSYVLNKAGSRSVCLGVCPIQFSLYLKVRCCFDELLLIKQSPREIIGHIVKLQQLSDVNEKFIDHYKSCECDRYVRNGSQALMSILLKLDKELWREFQ